MSSHSLMFNVRQVLRAVFFVLLLSLFVAAHASFAYGQNFTLTPSAFTPVAGVDPGGIATATIALSTSDNFSGSVALNCTVTPTDLPGTPVCLISPSTATPDATPSLTLTTSGSSSAGQYTVTVTGTSGTETETATLFLNVVEVPQDYTLSITKTISPTTIPPGSIAQATVTVTPIASYTGSVTLSCLSVTPSVLGAPYCTFTPATVTVTNGPPPTSVLTINTYGTLQNVGKLWGPRSFYAFWLAMPGLALVGIGGARVRKKLLGLFLLLAVAIALLMLPACGGITPTINNTQGFVTPKNSYTLTLTGVDENGVLPSNSTSATAQATVTVAVN